MRRRERGDLWVSDITQHRQRFRFEMGRGGKRTHRASYATLQEATAARRAVLRQIDGKAKARVEEVLTLYEAHKVEDGNRSASALRERRRVESYLGHAEGPLPKLTPDSAKALYESLRTRITRRGKPASASEHQGCLKAAKRFGAWLVEEGYWGSNPIKEVRSKGKALRGEESKPQLGQDQARMWLDGALVAFELGDQAALAGACILLLGARPGEVCALRLSHLDNGGTSIRIIKSKTQSGIRGLPLPEVLHKPMQEQAVRARSWARAQAVVPMDPPLWPPIAYEPKGPPCTGPHMSTTSLLRGVRRVCAAVGLAPVCAHALRGTFASLAVGSGEAIHAVARTLGHSGTQVTARHYATDASQAAGRASRTAALITPPSLPHGPGADIE